MKLISHRGNTDGPIPNLENNPEYILESLNLGFDVEVDVWYVNNNFYLGHDEAKYLIDEKFLENNRLWCHAKNIDSLYKMLNNDKIHCFWHQKDDFTITSRGFIWTHPNKELTSNSICVLPEIQKKFNSTEKIFFGICSDYIKKYKN
jgi:hypothetical protein